MIVLLLSLISYFITTMLSSQPVSYLLYSSTNKALYTMIMLIAISIMHLSNIHILSIVIIISFIDGFILFSHTSIPLIITSIHKNCY
jgi:hypothetical protein